MIRVTSFYEMDPEQIESLFRCESNVKTHPYSLMINTKTGRSHSVHFTTEQEREREIRRVVKEIERAKNSNRVTVDVIRCAVAAEIDKLRPYLRRIEKILKETRKDIDK